MKKQKQKIESNVERYFIDCDFNTQEYLIPIEYRKEWYKWIESNEADTFNAEAPKFAKPIDVRYLTFTNPKII